MEHPRSWKNKGTEVAIGISRVRTTVCTASKGVFQSAKAIEMDYLQVQARSNTGNDLISYPYGRRCVDIECRQQSDSDGHDNCPADHERRNVPDDGKKYAPNYCRHSCR